MQWTLKRLAWRVAWIQKTLDDRRVAVAGGAMKRRRAQPIAPTIVLS